MINNDNDGNDGNDDNDDNDRGNDDDDANLVIVAGSLLAWVLLSLMMMVLLSPFHWEQRL